MLSMVKTLGLIPNMETGSVILKQKSYVLLYASVLRVQASTSHPFWLLVRVVLG